MEENEEEKKEECLTDEIMQMVDSKIKEFKATNINANNLDVLYKLVDIKKDLKNIEHWKKEEENNEIRKL